MFRFVVLPCFDLGLTVPMYVVLCVTCTCISTTDILGSRQPECLLPRHDGHAGHQDT